MQIVPFSLDADSLAILDNHKLHGFKSKSAMVRGCLKIENRRYYSGSLAKDLLPSE